jgi:peptide/nickel transport system substrate-binding protein
LAIDREAIAETLYGGAAEPGTGWGLYPFSHELTAPEYDPDEARRLLEEAGWPEDYEFELWIQPSPQLGDVKTLTEAIAAMLDDVGIKTAISTVDLAQGQQRFQAFDVDGVITPSGGRLWWDPSTPWQVLFHSGSLYQSWYSEEMDAMLDELAVTNDADARLELQKQIHHYMIDDQMIMVPLVSGTSVYGVSEDVGDWPALRGPLALYFEYVTHADPLGNFRLFEP